MLSLIFSFPLLVKINFSRGLDDRWLNYPSRILFQK